MSDIAVNVNTTDNVKSKYTPGTVYKIIIAMTFLIAFGLIMIFSASGYDTARENFTSQLKVVILSTALMILAVYVPYGLYKRLAWILCRYREYLSVYRLQIL